MPEHGGKLAVAVKRWAPHANFGALVDQVKRLPMAGVLVADYINPNMAKKLKAMGIQYFDTVGNAYINQPPVYVLVTGNKQQQTPVTSGGETNRAFDVAGLKVVFGFLCEPLLVGANYREIAGRTGIALGTVGWVINGLKGAGYIIDRGGGTGRRLVSRKKLLDRWVEAYPEKLKPKQRVGEFVADGPNWWKEIDIEEYGAYWCGEIAAAKYTKYLKPQTITIYLPEDVGNKLLGRARLHKAVDWTADGPDVVRIYRPFWPVEQQKNVVDRKRNEIAGLVHPILVYADLIATGDSRNLEAARMLYEQYIAEHIRED
jgi:hypothetical protein